MANRLRDDGKLGSGRGRCSQTEAIIGAADAPIDPKPDWKPDALKRQDRRGGDFFQTQYCFDMDLCRRYIARLNDFGVTERTTADRHRAVGSAKQARLDAQNLWGVSIPDWIIKRLDGATDQKAEGRAICAELIQECAASRASPAAHLMAPRQEAEMAEVIRAPAFWPNARSGLNAHALEG